MNDILKILYDNSKNNRLINIKDIEKILEFIINKKELNNYILDISVQPIRSNNLASYSSLYKKIIIYSYTIQKMIVNIENNVLNINDFEKKFYQNLCILQIILHEVEHANQEKISHLQNNIEAFIIRMTYLVNDKYYKQLYEYCPTERLAEIKSYCDINTLIKYLDNRYNTLSNILEIEYLQRLMIGYHYEKNVINTPLVTFFKLSEKEGILPSFEWYCNNLAESLSNVSNQFELNDRLKFGFPISQDEYANNMKKLIISLNNNFNNRININ